MKVDSGVVVNVCVPSTLVVRIRCMGHKPLLYVSARATKGKACEPQGPLCVR